MKPSMRVVPALALVFVGFAATSQASPITSFSGNSTTTVTGSNNLSVFSGSNIVNLPNLFISTLFNTSGGSFPVGSSTAFVNGTLTYNTTGQPANLGAATSSLGTLSFTVSSPFVTP